MRRLTLAMLLLVLGLAAPGGVAAHTGVPERRERVQAGPYALELRYYGAPRAGQSLALMVAPLEGPQPTEVRIAATLGAGSDAVAARVRVAPDPDDPAATDALIPLATAGLWQITIEANGPAGAGRAETGIIAAAPGAVPVPVGWAIGLSPLVGVVGFAVAQRRWLRGMTNAK